jgi:CRP/FNR family transcriptional regulator, anaerobic regulatory protein
LERTAYVLLQMFVRAEEAGLTENGTVIFPFTQQHLADTLGMSLVHTNKTLKRIFQSKAVRWEHRTFQLIDRAALSELSGEGVKKRLPRPFI